MITFSKNHFLKKDNISKKTSDQKLSKLKYKYFCRIVC